MCLLVQIEDGSHLVAALERYQETYNADAATPLKLVFFEEATEQLSRLLRVLRKPGGSSILIGPSSVGKQSLATLASSIQGFTLVQPNSARKYSAEDLCRDIKVNSCRLCNQAAMTGWQM